MRSVLVGLALGCLLVLFAPLPQLADAAEIPVGDGVLTGQIAAGTTPVEGVTVDAFPSGVDAPSGSSTTGPDGVYTLTLPAGSYQLRVTDPSPAYWETTWVGSPDGSRLSAPDLVVSDGGTLTTNAQVQPVSSVLPLLANGDEQLSGACNLYYSRYDTDTQAWSTPVQDTGKVLLGFQVDPGTYRFECIDTDAQENALPTWYPATTDVNQAQSVIVGENSPGVRLAFDMVMRNHVEALGPAGITGSGWVGDKLTTVQPSWNVAWYSQSSRWIRDDGVLLSSNTWTYTPTTADFGHTIRLELISSRTDYEPGTAVSAAIAITDLRPIDGFALTGANKVGSALRVALGSWTHPLASETYQWIRNDEAIPGATAATYPVSRADIGKRLAVRLTVTTVDGHTATRTLTASGCVRTVSSILVAKRVSRVAGHKVARMVATLRLPGNPNPYRPGRYSAYRGAHRLDAARPSDGARLSWRLPPRPGRYTYRVVFTGNKLAVPVRKKLTVRVR